MLVRAGAVGGGDGGDKSGIGLLSTSTSISGTGSSPLGESMLHHLLPPPDPVAGE